VPREGGDRQVLQTYGLVSLQLENGLSPLLFKTHLHQIVTTATNQNLIQVEIKRRLNSGNACYHSVHNVSSSRLLPTRTNVKIRIHKTIILPVVLYGCEAWSLTLREEHSFEGV
jgi:hypothetical protein